MTEARPDPDNPLSFTRLMRLGHVAHAQGDNRSAHHFWRQAAILQPDNEQVWEALLNILDSEQDKRVCLNNILTINPQNKLAQTHLRKLDGYSTPALSVVAVTPDVMPREELRTIPAWRGILRVVQAVLIGLLIAVALIAGRYIEM